MLKTFFLKMTLLHYSCSRQQVINNQESISSEKTRCLKMNKAETPEVVGKGDVFKLN